MVSKKISFLFFQILKMLNLFQRIFTPHRPKIMVSRTILSMNQQAKIHQSMIRKGLEEFFENGQSLPVFDPAAKKIFGRAWCANELRRKSFEDLHKLWWVLIKEMNLLSTQKSEAKRMGQRWFGMHRVHKCRLSMARIKTILTERNNLHQKAVRLIKTTKPPSEGELLMEIQKKDKMRQLWRKRHFRKRMNYRVGRRSIFV